MSRETAADTIERQASQLAARDDVRAGERAEWRPVSELPLPDRDNWGVPYVVGRWMTLNRFDPPKWVWKVGHLIRTNRTYGQEPDQQGWTVFWTDDCSAQSARNGLPTENYPTHYLRHPSPPSPGRALPPEPEPIALDRGAVLEEAAQMLETHASLLSSVRELQVLRQAAHAVRGLKPEPSAGQREGVTVSEATLALIRKALALAYQAGPGSSMVALRSAASAASAALALAPTPPSGGDAALTYDGPMNHDDPAFLKSATNDETRQVIELAQLMVPCSEVEWHERARAALGQSADLEEIDA